MQMAYSEQLLFYKKNDLFFEIPSLFSGCIWKVPKECPECKSAFYKKFLEFISEQLLFMAKKWFVL